MKKILFVVLALLLARGAFAQNANTGMPNSGSFDSEGIDVINRQNLNVYVTVPLLESTGRGLNLNLALAYNSSIWSKTNGAWTPLSNWGWITSSPIGNILFSYTTGTCQICVFINHCQTYTTFQYGPYSFMEPNGTVHPFNVAWNHVPTPCNGAGDFGTKTGYATDGSGFYLDASAGTAPVVYSPSGARITTSGMTDTNGNTITSTVVNNNETDWADSVGRTALKVITNTLNSNIGISGLDQTGQTQQIVVGVSTINIKTNFGCPGVVEYTGSAKVVTQITLANQTNYFLTYEQTPGLSGYSTGRLQRVTLPTGGYYEFDYPGANDSINCADGTTTNVNRVMSDGTNTSTWKFVRTQIDSSHWKTVATAPQMPYDTVANDAVFTFTGGQQTQALTYQGSSAGTGTLLRTVNSTWAGVTPASVTTILEDGQTQSEVEMTYDATGSNMLTLKEHDWGSSAPGPVLRTITWTYGGPFLDRLTRKTIQDSSSATKYRQDITYDSTAITICPTGVPGHVDAYNCSYTARGNATSITNYTNASTPSGAITKNLTYDAFGNLVQADADCCQQKKWNFSAVTQYAFPDSVVSGASGGNQLTSTYTYNQYKGWVTSKTDPNNQKTSFLYDASGRVTSVTRPDNVVVAESFIDGSASSSTATIPVQGSNSRQTSTALDKLGRPIKTTIFDANGTSYQTTETQYDPTGRPYKTSNPHNSIAQYWTTSQFDALGRPTKTILPDGAQTVMSYSTNTATSTDPAGKAHKSVVDGLGRLVSVYEPDPANGNALTIQTTYSYNVLNSVTVVTQGIQTRTYTRDDLGRVTSSQIPETNQLATSLQYNSFGLITQKTDARGVITTYGYDNLNRISSVSYNVGSTGVPATPSIGMTYGTTPSQNNNGRLITMTDGVGSESYSYDILGRMTQLQKAISGTTYTLGYGYDAGNQFTSITYPSGRVVQMSLDAIGRLASIADTLNSVNTTRASNFAYNTAFQTTSFSYGNGVVATAGYSSDRLQLQSLAYVTGSSTLFSTNYWYKADPTNCPNAPSADNGQIQCITDNVDSGRSVNYTYDALYRLTSAVTNGSANYVKWGLNWTYDRYGNRLSQNAIYDTPPTNSLSFANPGGAQTNHPDGMCFDANGNLTAESGTCPPAAPTYTWDAANRLVNYNGSAATYMYDGNNLRVKKVNSSITTVYIFAGSKVLAEYDNGAAPNSPSREYLYVGGALLAKIESGSATYFHQDHLSNRVQTDSSGNVVGQLGSYPWGDQWYSKNTATKWSFTTYERDSESENDYSLARYYANRFGRFLSVDTVSGTPANPQSQNRYTYGANDPISNSDPSGLVSPYWFTTPFIPHYGAEMEFELLVPFLPGAESARGWNPQAIPQGPDLGLPLITPSPLLLGPTPQPAPPPGYEDCIIGALEEVLASGETPGEPNDGYGTLVRGTIAEIDNPTSMMLGAQVGMSGGANLPLQYLSLYDRNPGIFVQVHPGDGPKKWSSAFGRFQITYRTANYFGFKDWTPSGQDDAGAAMLKFYDAVQPAMQGNIQQALWNMWPWQSMPDSSLGGNHIPMATAMATFQAALSYLPECQ
jgi:RHS repeat-associated protein